MTHNKKSKIETIYLSDKQQVGDIPKFKFPTGIVEKRNTGIGATQAEIKSDRNSIIVFPSKSIAYNKSKSNKNTFYVGSLPEKKTVKVEDIRAYYQDKEIKIKKYLVVADSLHKVFDALGEKKIYSEFFFMFDEIDKFQDESTFRSALELCLDYFLNKDCTGCLLSATVGSFSNPKLRDLPRIVIAKTREDKVKMNIFKLQALNHIIKFLFQKIQENPNDTFLIAHKSVQTIKRVVSRLDKKSRCETKILCGEGSKDDVDPYYGTIEMDVLPGRINFMTSAYFSGIDIEQDFHLVIISDNSTKFSLLTISEIRQIVGRCRKTLKSVDLIIPEESYKIQLEPKSKLLSQATAFWKSVQPYSLRLGKINLDEVSITKNKVSQTELTYQGVKLVRLDGQGNYKISYFTIDQYCNRNREIRSLYSTRYNPIDGLSQYFKVIEGSVDVSKMDFQDDYRRSFLDVIQKQSFDAPVPTTTNSDEERILARYKVCQLLMDHSDNSWIIEKLYWNPVSFRKEYIKRYMAKYPVFSELWKYMEGAFKAGEYYSQDVTKSKIGGALVHYNENILGVSEDDYIPILYGFFTVKKSTSLGINGFKIVSMNDSHNRIYMPPITMEPAEKIQKYWNNI